MTTKTRSIADAIEEQSFRVWEDATYCDGRWYPTRCVEPDSVQLNDVWDDEQACCGEFWVNDFLLRWEAERGDGVYYVEVRA